MLPKPFWWFPVIQKWCPSSWPGLQGSAWPELLPSPHVAGPFHWGLVYPVLTPHASADLPSLLSEQTASQRVFADPLLKRSPSPISTRHFQAPHCDLFSSLSLVTTRKGRWVCTLVHLCVHLYTYVWMHIYTHMHIHIHAHVNSCSDKCCQCSCSEE